MNQIHIIDQSTIDKIAAGEVVERPASIVKELTENAIDAGATRITVEIRDGGISMIRITDNGSGIAPEDIPLAFLRHATSKISDIKDLDVLNSLGFRGEALSSISAVSRVELITKKAEELAAVRYLIEGGREKSIEEIGAPDGTTIIVRDVFYNTPARAKFLKTPLTEASHVGSTVEQLILSNPAIAFTFIVNGQTKLTSQGSGNLINAICSIYGRMYKDLTLPVRMEADWISITGFIGKPEASRGNRNSESYYVNGRAVKSRIISKGIEDGYGTRLMQHQYPFTCIMIRIDGHEVDVNVHPQKMDVRFSDEKRVYDALKAVVESAFASVSLIVESPLEEKPVRAKEEERKPDRKEKPLQAFETIVLEEPAPYPLKAAGEPSVQESPTACPEKSIKHTSAHADGAPTLLQNTMEPKARTDDPESTDHNREDSPTLAPCETEVTAKPSGHWEQMSFRPEFLAAEAKPMRRIVGQVFNTYWICEYEGKMYLFDQHAAHERVLFEKLMQQYSGREISSQMINPPVIVTLDSRQQALLEQYLEAFTGLGFEIEPFGDRDYAIRAVPYSLGSIRSSDLFTGLLDQLETSDKADDLEAYIHRVATEACKAAVKGGRKIALQEAAALLDDLMNCNDPYHCPHGRPTIISFTRSDIEKRFKRIVT